MGRIELVHPLPDHLPDAADPRADHAVIAVMVNEGAKVLDIGCGDGALIALLARERGARARGLEIDQTKVHSCVRRGLSVVQGDAECDLGEIPSGAFDYVVLSHTIQHLRRPSAILNQAARIADRVIVSIENAGRWRTRMRLMTRGRLADWDRDALRVTTVRDFAEFAQGMRLTIERAIPIARGNTGAPFAKTLWRANWFAEEAVFLLAT